MSKINAVWVPGLLGTSSIFNQDAATFKAGNAAAARVAVTQAGGVFSAVNYQHGDTDETRYGTFSAMAQHMAAQIDPASSLLIASSVGAAMAMQSLFYRKAPVDMIFLMPVVDVLTKAMQLGGEHAAKVKNGLMPMLPIPVQSTEVGGQAGHFPLKKHHFDDNLLLQPMTQPVKTQFALMQGKVKPIGRLAIVHVADDPMCTMAEADRMATTLQPLVREPVVIETLFGKHGDNRTDSMPDVIGKLIKQRRFGC